MTSKTIDGKRIASNGDSGLHLGRLIYRLLLVLIGVGAAMIFLLAIGTAQPEQLPWGAQLAQLTAIPSLPAPAQKPLSAAIALLTGLVAFGLLLRGLRAGPSAAGARHVLISDEKGFVVVEKRGIATVAISAVKRISGVVDAHVEVLGGGAAPVRLVIRASIHAGAELKTTGDLARQRAKEAVERLVGLEVLDVLVKVEVVPLEELDRIVE